MRLEDRLTVATNRLQSKEKELQTALLNSTNLLGENARLSKALRAAVESLDSIKVELVDLKNQLKALEKRKTKNSKPAKKSNPKPGDE